MNEIAPSPRLEAFLAALPLAKDEEFVNAVGIGVFRAKHVRRGLERGVLAVHWTGSGLAIVQPKEHGVCPHCSASKSRSICTHCACIMCSWERVTDELASPPVGRAKLLQLVARLKAFQFGAAPAVAAPMLDDDVL